MKIFNTFTAPNGDVPDNAPEESTRPTDQLFNNLTKEMMRVITESGQTLTTLTNDDLTQLSKAVNIHAITANVWDCTNVGNNYTLMRPRGDYDENQSLYGGAKISFNASATNTGAVNVTIQSGSLAFTLPLLLDGSPLVGGELLNSKWYDIVYYSGTLQLLTKNNGTAASRDVGIAANQIPDMSFFDAVKSNQGYQKLPSGVILQWGEKASAASTTTSAAFPMAFPTACLRVVATGLNVTALTHTSVTINNVVTGSFTFNAFSGASGTSPVIAPLNGVICQFIAIGH